MKFPAGIPKSMPSHMGSIPVHFVDRLKLKDDTKLMGCYRPKHREIQLRAGNLHPMAVRQTLWHEWVHAILIDAYAVPKDHDQEEAVCDAMGMALAVLFT